MKTRIVLTILLVLGMGPWLLSRFEGSEAAGPDTTMTQELAVVGQVGGKITAVAVQSNYVYVAVGRYLEIYDGLEPAALVPVSKTDAFPKLLTDVAVAGSYAYLGQKESVLRVMDVTDPFVPVEVGNVFIHSPLLDLDCIELGDGYIDQIEIHGSYAFVVVNVYCVLGFGSSLHILDVSDPTNPHEISNYVLTRDIVTTNPFYISVANHKVYLTHQHDLYILDVSEPIDPMLLVTHDLGYLGSWMKAIVVRGIYAYLVIDNHFLIFNVSNPQNPVVVGHSLTTGEVYEETKLVVDDTQAYLLTGQDFAVFDITNKATPLLIGLDESLNPRDMAVADGYAYVVAEALNVFDTAVIPASAVNHKVNLTAEAGSQIVPLSITEVVPFSSAINLIVQGDYLYVYDGRQLQILFTPEGRKPVKVGTYPPDAFFRHRENFSMVKTEDYLYILDQGEWGELHILDISQPERPTLVSHTVVSGYSFVVAGQYIYLDNWNSFSIWDVSDPYQPIQTGSYSTCDWCIHHVFGGIGQYVYVLFSDDYGGSISLDIVNVTDPFAPFSVGEMPLSGGSFWPQEFVVRDDIAYLVGDREIYVVDVIEPSTPVQIGIYATEGGHGITSAEVAGNVAYVGIWNEGIRLLDISDPTQIQLMTLYELPNMISLVMDGDKLYVAAGDVGVLTWRLVQETVTSTEAQFSSPSADVMVQFDAGGTGTIGYQRWWGEEQVGSLMGMDLRFELTAVANPQLLEQTEPYSITVHYNPHELGPVREDTLALYYEHDNQWLREPSSTLNLIEQTITVAPAQMGQFMILGEPYRTFLPMMTYRHNRHGYRLHFSLDQSGSTFSDGSGYGHDGRCQITACPTLVHGVRHMGQHFDGLSDVIQLANPQTLNLQGEITIAAWVKPETGNSLQNIVAHGYATAPQGEVFLRIANGRYEIGSWDGSDHKTSFAISANDMGQWVHLVGVYDGTTWRLYRNGVEVSSAVDGTGAVSIHGRWAIGATGNGDGRFFQGSIDEVKVYEHGLTAAEVAELYEGYLSQ